MRKKVIYTAMAGVMCATLLSACVPNTTVNGKVNLNVTNNGSEIISETYEFDENGKIESSEVVQGGKTKPGENTEEGQFPGGLDDDGREPGEDGNFPGGLDDDGKGPDEDNELKGKAVSASFDVIYNNEGASEYAVITAYDMKGRTCWTYKTDEDYLTELERLQEIVMTDKLYIFAAFGDIIALNNSDGSVAWVNHDFKGASLNWTMDYEGETLYMCGYYGPDLFVMDFDGNTLNKISSKDDECFWPYKILYVNANQVDVTFESNDKTISFDPKGAKEQ